MRRETILHKPGAASRRFRVIDADGIPLGRLAAEVAIVLMGKDKPDYTPHVMSGDRVIVTNAKKVELTGRKAELKYSKHYTGYPDGLRTETWGSLRDRRPEKLIRDAVRRMLPKNRLSRHIIKDLYVYEGAEHPHGNHKPSTMGITYTA